MLNVFTGYVIGAVIGAVIGVWLISTPWFERMTKKLYNLLYKS